tara:strand:- start:2197 stop:2976 length:780 start_codon:yes stop_codon:yes gene_type:complete
MEVDAVLRGDDHLSNTPRQIALLNSLGLKLPEYAHVSLFTGRDGAPLSKRNGSLSIRDLREKGYLPIAVLNYLSRVGHKINDNELKTLEGLAESFDTSNISSSPSKLDMDQLLFWQKKAVESLNFNESEIWLEEAMSKLPSTVNRKQFISLIIENINFPEDASSYIDNLFLKPLRNNEIIQSAGKNFYYDAIEVLNSDVATWSEITKAIGDKTSLKGKALFMPLRAAITGQTFGPELDKVFELIGKEKVIERLEEASKL